MWPDTNTPRGAPGMNGQTGQVGARIGNFTHVAGTPDGAGIDPAGAMGWGMQAGKMNAQRMMNTTDLSMHDMLWGHGTPSPYAQQQSDKFREQIVSPWQQALQQIMSY